MKWIKLSVLFLGLTITAIAYAIAPVVDAYDDDEDEPVAVTQNSSATNTSSASNVQSSNNNASQTALPSTSTSPPPVHTAHTFSLDQRVAIQEQQIANLNPLLVQVDDLTQKVQILQGRMDELNHVIKRLADQSRTHYTNLQQRLAQKTTLVSSGTEVSTATNNLIKNKKALPQSTSSVSGERAYQAAFQLLKNKLYQPATEAFEDFTKKYPKDMNQANANYFLGQLYLLQGQPNQSITCFKRFINLYPQDVRQPDAMLQLGLAYFAKGDKNTAITLFKKIIQQYPDSRAAQAAQARLQQFQAMVSTEDGSMVVKEG